MKNYGDIKKLPDFILSLILLILSLPLIITLMIIVFLITRQKPVIIQERRLTLDGRKIKMVKIRTLKGEDHLHNMKSHPEYVLFKHELKRYVPPFCGWLRRSGLDEITQLLNVLKGEMSLVGPRPLLLEDLQTIKDTTPELYKRREKIKSKPGITGNWQIFGDRSKGFENLIELDEHYEVHQSFSYDLKLLFYTSIVSMSAMHSDSIIVKKRNPLSSSKDKMNLSTE